MKLLITYFVPSGGLETLNRLRARALMEAGIEVHLLYLRAGAGIQNMSGIPYFITNHDPEIQSILQTYNYDAIIASCDHLMLERLRRLGYKGKLLYEAQGLGDMEQAAYTLDLAVPYIRQHAQGILSPITSHLMTLFNTKLPEIPRFYLNNMVDTTLFSYKPSPWLNPSGQPILAWIGRLEPNKNWPLFLQIGERLAHHKLALALWMFEDANIAAVGEREKFTVMVDQLGLRNRLVVRSNVPHHEMPHYLSAVGDSGGMLVSTSQVEGFGYAVAEAMACRCPVLSTDSDGVRAFINHNHTGKFFHTRTAEEAEQEALHLMSSPALAHHIRHEARQHIQTAFSQQRYVTDVVNVLAALGLFR